MKDKDIYICRKGHKAPQAEERRSASLEINLILISENDKWHYAAIKSLSRLLTCRNTKNKCKQHFCMNCLQGFTLELSRDEHYSYCIDSKGSTVEFYDGQNQFKVPFMMYADFESILMPIQGPNPDQGKAYTTKVNQHIPSGWCVYSKFA